MGLVYSTETGRIHQEKAPAEAKPSSGPNDGVIRILRQTKGRKGKGVCIITGLKLNDAELKLLAGKLKKLCGCGGAIKQGQIEIQGDNREKLKEYLEKQGYKVKLAGG
ncbi:stress response translation initiation inhibitor YciH [Dongshaea marina]|uniref:stress response translation initiation inhibitor YciH n=1 Tax=Dongshaea marina TaxID=2047966 RepID=UPI000D3E5DD5|nr:stress response translation initiation inhibitor YciH [Dongshaea marina]